LIFPGNPHDRHNSQYGHPGFGAHPIFRNIGFLKNSNPIKKTKIPRTMVISILVKFGFNDSLIFMNLDERILR